MDDENYHRGRIRTQIAQGFRDSDHSMTHDWIEREASKKPAHPPLIVAPILFGGIAWVLFDLVEANDGSQIFVVAAVLAGFIFGGHLKQKAEAKKISLIRLLERSDELLKMPIG